MSESEKRYDSIQVFWDVVEKKKYGKKQNCTEYIADKKHRKEKRTRLQRRISNTNKFRRRKRIVDLPSYKPSRGYIIGGKTYLMYPKNSNPQRWHKRRANRAVRRLHEVPKGNGYRKYYEYWYNIY